MKLSVHFDLDIPAPSIGLPKAPHSSRVIARMTTLALLAVAVAAGLLFTAREGGQTAGTNSVTTPDNAGSVGQYSSLALDNKGNPVVSYYDDGANSDLKVMHCSDPNCAGGDESITSPDAAEFVGQHTSIALDAAGRPVVSYYDFTNTALKIMHCNDVNCAGGDDSITSPDGAVGVVNGRFSLKLDAAGRPVVSYYDGTLNSDLKIMHCNDVNCAGGDESITSPDTAGVVGDWTSLALDAAGRPVVSYHDSTNGDLKIMHCNDANCAGGGESITSPDTASDVGEYTSIALDAAGRPVVSYWNAVSFDLKVMHCNDVNCAGGGESITTTDTAGQVGEYTSIALDAAGRPVVSYHHLSSHDLKVMHCNDENCAGGDESISSPDAADSVGVNTSLALDAAGRPVVSYYDNTNSALKVLHCGTPTCNNNPGTQEIRIASLTTGWPDGPMGGACYDIENINTQEQFEVCDNQTPFVQVSSCDKDGDLGLCNDNDPTTGSISVAVFTDLYNVTAASAPGHRPDPRLKFCDPLAGVDAKCTFTHVPLTRPWFPWDVNGDGAIASADFYQVLARFGQTK
jgi:hypothetical protein